MPLRTSQQGFKLLKEPFGTNRVYLVFNLGASPNQKLILCRLTAFRAPLPSSRGHLAAGGIVMLQSNRVPETRRLGSTEAVSLNHLAGIRTFIEGFGPNRMDQRGDARLVSSRWPDLVRKLPPKN